MPRKKIQPATEEPAAVSKPKARTKQKEKITGVEHWFHAFKRHGLNGKLKYSHTSNLADEIDSSYTIGMLDKDVGILMIVDKDSASVMKFTPRQLEELKFHIDDVLVEMGLNAINVMSANDHVWKTSPRRK